MTERTCHYCKQPGGVGRRELRPYGPGGTAVCAECVLGEGAPPEWKEEAERQFASRLAVAGPVAVIDGGRQDGPVPLSEVRRRLICTTHGTVEWHGETLCTWLGDVDLGTWVWVEGEHGEQVPGGRCRLLAVVVRFDRGIWIRRHFDDRVELLVAPFRVVGRLCDESVVGSDRFWTGE